MYYELYQSIKQQVAGALGLETGPDGGLTGGTEPGGLQDIRWFTNQYEGGTVTTAPCLLVECLPLAMSRQMKEAGTTDIGVRLHVVSALAGDAEGVVEDSDVEAHEALALRVLAAVEDGTFRFDGGVTRPLRLAAWAYQPKQKGYLVTWIDLKTKG